MQIIHPITNLFAFAFTFFSLPLAGAFGQAKSHSPAGPHTLYSADAASLDSASEKPLVLRSPDRKKTLTIRIGPDKTRRHEGLTVYTVRVAGHTFEAELFGFNGEVTWSPDSKAFAATETEGGGGIGSRVYVFYVSQDGLQKLDISAPIERDFGSPVQCDVEVPPNTGFISWRQNSTLLVAAEVIPVSFCECKGTYRVYDLALPSVAIIRTYTQLEAKKRFWSLMGIELRDADNKCVGELEQYFRNR